MEDWLIEGEQWSISVTFAYLGALLVDSKIHDRCEVVHYIEAILESNLHVVFCSFLLHPSHVLNGIGVTEIETVVILLDHVSMAVKEFCSICAIT